MRLSTMNCLIWAFLASSVALNAQSVTTSGTTTANTVPLFSGSSSVTNSVITQSGSNIGIGTSAPIEALDVNGNLHLALNSYIAGMNPPYWGGYGGFINFTGSCCSIDATHAGYGVWVNYNAYFNGSNWIQPRGDQYSYLFTSNDHMNTGFGFFMATANGTNGGTITPTLVAQINSNGMGYFAGGIGVGTKTPSQPLEVNGNVKVDGGIYFPGSSTPQTVPWTGVVCGGDYAEDVKTKGHSRQYEPGDVLVISSKSSSDVEKSREPYSTSVAGVYATKPGVIGKRDSMAKVVDEVPMAMVGIVPTKVSTENGPIHRGDLLVTSARPGYAMKGTERSRLVGAVIGKAMGSLDSGNGTIEVLITLQ